MKALDEDVKRKVVLIKTAQEDKGRIIEKIGKAIKAGEEVTGKTEGLEKDYNDIKETCEKDIQRYESLKVSAGNLHMEKQSLQERICYV